MYIALVRRGKKSSDGLNTVVNGVRAHFPHQTTGFYSMILATQPWYDLFIPSLYGGLTHGYCSQEDHIFTP